jgi:hypothetical protein
MDNKFLRKFYFWTLVFLFFLASSNLSFGEIIAQPGTFDHFQIEAPDKLLVGKDHKIILYAVDIFGNKVNMPKDFVRELRLSTTGNAQINPSIVKSNEINSSGLSINIRNEKSEEVVVSLYENNRPYPILEKRIKFITDALNALFIKHPDSVKAGKEFMIQIFGVDKYGNLVCDYDPKEINVFFKGDLTPEIKEFQFSPFNCTVDIKLYTEKMGNFYLEASLLNKNIYGKSGKIEVLNGEIAYFIVNAPQEAVVDESFDLTIIALDKFNNFVKDFASKKEKVIIEAKGKVKIFPYELLSQAFSDGKANINLRYNIPEDIKIIVKLAGNTNITGESSIIKIQPQKVKRFEIFAPDTIIAGQRFKVKIVAYNQLDKIMSSYNLYGKNVILKTTGSGNLSPNIIPPSAFNQGVAIVDLTYDRAEKFDIIATTEQEDIPSKYIHKEKTKKVKTKHKKEVKKTKKDVKGKSNLLELKNITQIESKNECQVIFNIPNIDKAGRYFPKTIKDKKTMTVLIEISPAINKTEGAINFESEFIKEIFVKEEKEKVLVKIVLKNPLRYHLTKQKDQLIVTFRRA